MKVVLIVDWVDFRPTLSEPRSIPAFQAIIERITAAAQDTALSATATLESMRVYSNPQSLDSEEIQNIFDKAGFEIHTQPGSATDVKERIIADCMELLIDNDCKYFFLVCGAYEYEQLARSLKSRGARIEIWRNLEGGSSPTSSIVDQSDGPVGPSLSTRAGELSGVLRLLRTEITKRTQRQLHRNARLLSRESEVIGAFRELITKINASKFAPNCILAWTDETRHWNGSVTVAERLASELKIKMAECSIREEGESRRILKMPNLDASCRLLIVDDAAFSGRTLKMLRRACQELTNEMQTRTAVLSAVVPISPDVDFYAATHTGTDVLFPWGWARSVDQFYDLLRELGTRDRRWMPRLVRDGITTTKLTEFEPSSAYLLTNEGGARDGNIVDAAIEPRTTDHLIYAVRSRIIVTIEGIAGDFEPGEFIYIPSVVPYSLTLSEHAEAIRLEFQHAKSVYGN